MSYIHCVVFMNIIVHVPSTCTSYYYTKVYRSTITSVTRQPANRKAGTDQWPDPHAASVAGAAAGATGLAAVQGGGLPGAGQLGRG